jgi:hypothetical protein
MVGGECGKICNEEEIEKQLDSIRFMPLGEDELLVIRPC